MFKLGIGKTFIALYVNLTSILWLLLDQRLTVFHHLLSWTSFGILKCPIDKIIGSQDHLKVLGDPRVPSVLAKNSFTENFLKWINFKKRHCKNSHCPSSKITQHYQTLIDQRITVFHQLFSWSSVGPSKSGTDEMIGLQHHLTVWGVSWVPCV